MNRCKICGSQNDHDALLCKTCKTPFTEQNNIDQPNIFIDSMFGILFITYGLVIIITNLIILKKLLVEPILFVIIGVYSISANMSISSTKHSLRILEIQQEVLLKKIQNLENDNKQQS